MKVLVVVVLGFGLLTGIGPGANASAAHASPPALALRNGDGIAVDSSHWVDSRLLDLTVSTAALSKPAGVRVLVPASYRAGSARRYPVLYLLHGGFGSYTDWTTSGHAEQLTANLPLIVVMPEAGKGGWYSNWYNGGAVGPPEWETFHIDQLIPWVDANFRTIADRRGRAIAGLSMGGFGAMSYATRHPRMFAAVASFSGAVDTNNPGLRYLIYLSPIADGGTPGAIYGSSLFDNHVAEAHNPYNLASNLRGMHVAIYTGDGFPGPLDPPGTSSYDYQEFAVHEMSLALSRRLDELHIPHTFDDYGNGTHSWPYWNRDLGQELPAIMRTLSRPAAGDGKAASPGARHSGVRRSGLRASLARPAAASRSRPTPHPTSQPTGAAMLHVEAAGVDNPGCTQSSPCRTVSHAVAVASPGETIAVGPDSFTGDVTVDKKLAIEGSRGTSLAGSPASGAATVTIAAGADVDLKDLTVENPSPVGDGVDNSGTLTVTGSTISHCGGAGINDVSGPAAVNHTVISQNGAYGISNEGTVSIDDSRISGNDYGIGNDASLTIRNTAISDNGSAGLVTLRGTSVVDDSTVSGNTAEGIQSFSGTTDVDDTTSAGNGLYGIASSPTPYAAAPTVSVSGSTVAGNNPDGLVAPSPITLASTIVAGSRGGDCVGSVADAGYNLASDSTCGLSAAGSVSSTDPQLGPLQDNGGPTMTRAPEGPSKAVDVIPPEAATVTGGRRVALCSGTTDQRGVPRPQPEQSSDCDAGAVELAASVTLLRVTGSSHASGRAVRLTATVVSATRSPRLPAPSGTVRFSVGASAIRGCERITLSRRSEATCSATALPAGMDVISASYSGTSGYHNSSGTTTVDVRRRPPGGGS